MYFVLEKHSWCKRMLAMMYEPEPLKLQDRCRREGGYPDAVAIIPIDLSLLGRKSSSFSSDVFPNSKLAWTVLCAYKRTDCITNCNFRTLLVPLVYTSCNSMAAARRSKGGFRTPNTTPTCSPPRIHDLHDLLRLSAPSIPSSLVHSPLLFVLFAQVGSYQRQYAYDPHCMHSFCFDIHCPCGYRRSPDTDQPWPGSALRRTTYTPQEAKQRALPPRPILYHTMQDLHSWALLPRRPEPQPLWCRCIFWDWCDSVHSLSKWNILQQYVPSLSSFALLPTLQQNRRQSTLAGVKPLRPVTARTPP